MPSRSKSRTTTSVAARTERWSSEPSGRRLPRYRPPTHPGEMLLEEFLRPLGISQSALAVRLGIASPRLNEIIRGKRSMTVDTALRLQQVLGMPADFWLGLQMDWDLWHAMRGKRADQIAKLARLRVPTG